MTAAVFASIAAALLIVKSALAIHAARCAPRPLVTGGDAFADVVVLQAILSGDPRLGDTLAWNLASLASARFVWLVDSDDPDGQAIARALVDGHPRARLDVIVVPPPPEHANPKLFKLAWARSFIGDAAIVLVLDDDTRMPAASLSAIRAGLDHHELATGLPAYLDDGRWPSRLLAAFVNDNAALTYLPLLNVWPPVTINGMAYALRRDTLDALGGFAPLVGHLTDNLAVAEQVLSAGGRIAQTASPHWVQTTVADGRHYGRLLHRWLFFARLLLRRQSNGRQAVIAGLNVLPPLLLWAAVLSATWSHTRAAWAALGGLLVLRAVTHVVVERLIYGCVMHRPLFSLASELAMPWHLAHAYVSNTIVWRTRRYRVRDVTSFDSVR